MGARAPLAAQGQQAAVWLCAEMPGVQLAGRGAGKRKIQYEACKLPTGLQGRGFGSHPPWQAWGCTGAKGQGCGLQDSNGTSLEKWEVTMTLSYSLAQARTPGCSGDCL